MYSDQSIVSSSAGSSSSWLAVSSGESSLAKSSLSVTSSTSSSSGFCMISCFRICCSSRVGTWSSLSACCRRWVMISTGRCERFSECFISIVVDSLSQAEPLAEVNLPRPRVGGQILGRALKQDASLVHDVRTVGDAQGLAHVVVGDQDPESPLAQPAYDVLDLGHRDRAEPHQRP